MFGRHFFRISYVAKTKVMLSDVCFEAMTENLSADGVFIRTDSHLPVGRKVTLNFNIPNAFHPSITVKGEIVRNDPQGLAVQFRSLDYETFADLKAVIKQKPLPVW